MPANKPYRQEHAEALLLPCDEGSRWEIDEQGVRPVVMDYREVKRLGLEPEHEALSWKPVMAFQDDQNAPDCKNTPALPFPFDAKDLAAFMVAGVGAFVADYYGEWEDGPDDNALASIDPANNYARRAVREAFDAYREAVKSVGELDYDDAARARELVRQYGDASKRANEREGVFELGITDDEVKARRARATASVADLKAEAMRLQAEVTAKMDAWRDAMARELLTPKVAPEPALVDALPAQPQAQAAAPAPVADESESNAPLQKAKAKRRTWKDVSASYIVEVMRAGRYTTAKELYRALESKAGANSPFDKGTGDNRGSLFVRDIAESLSLKTVQNNWQSLREQAKK